MAGIIINADDLGYSPGINRAIVDLHRDALVTSASLLVNQPHSEEGVALARDLPELSVGVHLNLSKGRPILAAERVASLVDDIGVFWDAPVLYRRALLGKVRWPEVEAELDAQIRWALAHGVTVDNLDSHVHFHALPQARRITEKLAARYDVAAWRSPNLLTTIMPGRVWTDVVASPRKPGRLLAPDYLVLLHQWGERLLVDPKIALVVSRPGVVTELVIHPGYADDPGLPAQDPMSPSRRQAEVDLVSSLGFRRWLKRLRLELIGFSGLATRRL